jgi:uncharacterized protein
MGISSRKSAFVSELHLSKRILSIYFTALEDSTMIKKLIFAAFIVTSVFFATASAQGEAASEKQTAVRELVALVNAGNNAQEIVAIMSRQMDSAREATLSSILEDRSDLTPAEKKSLFESINQNQKEMSRRFQEKMMAKLNYVEMVNEIGATLYDKYYTLEEIRELLAFYKTPTGQKTLKTMGPLMNDTMSMVQDRLLPKLPTILKEIQDEEKLELERQIEARKPRPKKARTE